MGSELDVFDSYSTLASHLLAPCYLVRTQANNDEVVQGTDRRGDGSPVVWSHLALDSEDHVEAQENEHEHHGGQDARDGDDLVADRGRIDQVR